MEALGEALMKYGPPVIGVIVFAAVAYVVSGWIGKLITKTLTKANVELTLGKFAGIAVKWTILILALIACLGFFGFEMTDAAALIGATGLAIGLALQGTLSNLSAGVMLQLFRPFKVDDFVNVNGYAGKVAEIDLFVTKLDTPDNRRIIVPNKEVFGATIENLTHHPIRRVDVSVGADYPADMDATRQALLDAVNNIPDVLTNPAAAAVLTDLGDSSVNWQLRVWTNTENFWPVRDAATRAAKMALDQAGIGIPFPQMDVHVESFQQISTGG